MVQLRVHVTPRSGRDAAGGWRGDELLVRVTAAPESGKANAAVCKVVAAALGIPKTAVRVTRGDTSRHKTLEVRGVSVGNIVEVFGGPEAPQE